jgi:hypothetical protein
MKYQNYRKLTGELHLSHLQVINYFYLPTRRHGSSAGLNVRVRGTASIPTTLDQLILYRQKFVQCCAG